MSGKLISCSLKEQPTCHNILPLQKIPFRCRCCSLHKRQAVQCAEKPFLFPSECTVTTLTNAALHKVQQIWSKPQEQPSLSFTTFSNRIKSSGIGLSQNLPRSFQIPFSYSLILHTSAHYAPTSNFICDANPRGVLL